MQIQKVQGKERRTEGELEHDVVDDVLFSSSITHRVWLDRLLFRRQIDFRNDDLAVRAGAINEVLSVGRSKGVRKKLLRGKRK